MANSSVHVRKTSPATLTEDIRKMLDESDFSKWDLRAPTYIKINGNYDRKYPGSNTSLWFMNGLLAALRKKGFEKLTVVEGDLPYFTADEMIQRTGMMDILDRYDVPFINYEFLERDENEIPILLRGAQVINVPVPHGHGFAVMSCAVKNLFGLVPNPRAKYHRILSEMILNLAEKVHPFTIVDATVGLVGPSTRRGTPQQMDLILAGWDTVAIDAVLTKMMGYEVQEIPHLKMAAERGLLPEVSIKGDYDWDKLPSFDWPLEIGAGRRLAGYLGSTWLQSWWLFRWVESKLERLYHRITFLRKRKQLFSGPWMEYERQMKKALPVRKTPSMIKVEMHSHTRFSPDAFITREQLVRRCREKQIDCVCITDHNTMRGAAEFGRQKDIKIIAGEEIKTQAGEIIGLFLKEEILSGLTLEQTVGKIKEQKGLVYLPHPFDEFRDSAVKIKDAEKIKDEIDLIEVFNSRTFNPKYNEMVRNFASDNAITTVVGSDAHHWMELGNCTMEIDNFDDPTSFLQNLRSARCTTKKCPFILRLYIKALKILVGKD